MTDQTQSFSSAARLENSANRTALNNRSGDTLARLSNRLKKSLHVRSHGLDFECSGEPVAIH